MVFIFVAEWCPHSKELRQHLETLAKEDSHVVIVLIDVDEAEVSAVFLLSTRLLIFVQS